MEKYLPKDHEHLGLRDKRPMPCPSIITINMANWSQNLPIGSSVAQISTTRWHFVKFSFQTCCQVAL